MQHLLNYNGFVRIDLLQWYLVNGMRCIWILFLAINIQLMALFCFESRANNFIFKPSF
jgi:hypothetical protein